MNQILKTLTNTYIFREKQLNELINLIGNHDEPIPDCIYIYGHSGTGKTAIVKDLLKKLKYCYAYINLIECYNNKILFESILNELINNDLVADVMPKELIKCENVVQFLFELKKNFKNFNENLFIIVDKAERLRKYDMLLSIFLRLQKLSKISVCVILISELPFENYYANSTKPPQIIYFDQYEKHQLLEILSLDFESMKVIINEQNTDSLIIGDLNNSHIDICQNFNIDLEFFKTYLNVFLSVYFRSCRDLNELRLNSKINFLKYCQPVLNGDFKSTDKNKLWRSIAPILKNNAVSLNLNKQTDDLSEKMNKLKINDNKMSQTTEISQMTNLELPFYSKFLLIAAFLASYNPAKEDRRLLMKNHGGKKRKTIKSIKTKLEKANELNSNLYLGPKSFSLDRLLAIFFAICKDEQMVEYNASLLMQITTLIELKLLSVVGNTDNDLNEMKYKCMVAHCYPKELSTYPQVLMDLLRTHNTVLENQMRTSFCRALILLRNKQLLAPTDLLSLFFQLLRCQDKNLRSFLQTHIITDIKNINSKNRNVKLNTTLENFMFSMLNDNNPKAAKMSIDIMIELYKKNIWNDTKTVNVIASGCFSKITKVMVASLKFFLGSDPEEESEKSDSDDEIDPRDVIMANKFNKKTRKREKQLEKVKKLVAKSKKNKSKAPQFNFSALHLIHDPQGLAEKLLKHLESTNERFEIKLMTLDLISRLIGLHQLFLFNFYPFIQRFIQPHQRDVTRLLQFAAQAAHELVPPDVIEPVMRAIVNNFVTERNSSDVMAIGLNAIREICNRCPLAMNEDLLRDLTMYKNYRDRSVMMAAKSLITLYRHTAPELLRKKDRGRPTEATIELRVKQYGEVDTKDYIPGVEVLLNKLNEDISDVEENSDSEWEDVSHSSDDEMNETDKIQNVESNKVKINKNKKIDKRTKKFLKTKKKLETKKQKKEEQQMDEESKEKFKKAKELVLDRILTNDDFKKIDTAIIQKQVQAAKKDKKRKLEEPESNSELVKLKDIENIFKKRKHDKLSRMESVKQGQSDRDQYGYKDGRVNEFCSKTNREKRKTKNFMMLKHKANRGKGKRSFKEKQLALRKHLIQQKKMK